jgi:hypothetical protein
VKELASYLGNLKITLTALPATDDQDEVQAKIIDLQSHLAEVERATVSSPLSRRVIHIEVSTRK